MEKKTNWLIRTYDVHNEMSNEFWIEDRTENEVFNEAANDSRVKLANDWTMTREEET